MLVIEASLRGNPDKLLSTHGITSFAMPLMFDAVAWPLRSFAAAARFAHWPTLQMLAGFGCAAFTYGGIVCNGLFVGSHLGVLPKKTDAGRAMEAAAEAQVTRHMSERAKTE